MIDLDVKYYQHVLDHCVIKKLVHRDSAKIDTSKRTEDDNTSLHVKQYWIISC